MVNYCNLGSGEMIPVKYLLCKHEDPSSSPQNLHKKQSIGAHVCNPNTGEMETDRFLGLTG